MKVKAYRTVCDIIEIPDEYLMTNPNSDKPDYPAYWSPIELTEAGAEKYLGEGENQYFAIEDMEDRIMAEF